MMMTDKELLTLAAKAAGLTLEDHHDANGEYWPWCEEKDGCWDPLTDDGDALRLAVRLRIAVDVSIHMSLISGPLEGQQDFVHELHDGDPYAATRRAIVKAAAEIGKGMP